MAEDYDFDPQVWADAQKTYDELDPERQQQVRRAALADNRRRAALAMQAQLDLKTLMQLPHFRRFMFTVLAKSGMYRAAFHPHEGALQYSEGRRGLGIELLDDMLRIDPQIALDMTREQAKLETKVNDAPQT